MPANTNEYVLEHTMHHGSATARGHVGSPGGRKGSYWFSPQGEEGTFNSGQINMALCLAPIGPGDGVRRTPLSL